MERLDIKFKNSYSDRIILNICCVQGNFFMDIVNKSKGRFLYDLAGALIIWCCQQYLSVFCLITPELWPNYTIMPSFPQMTQDSDFSKISKVTLLAWANSILYMYVELRKYVASHMASLPCTLSRPCYPHKEATQTNLLSFDFY